MCTFFGYFLYIKKRESQIPAPNAKPAFYLSPPTESSGTVSPEVHVPSTATMGPLFFRSLGAIRNHENWNICLYLHLKNINLSKIVVVFFLAVPWEIYGKCFEEIDVPKKKCSEKKVMVIFVPWCFCLLFTQKRIREEWCATLEFVVRFQISGGKQEVRSWGGRVKGWSEGWH